jgi:hypothetical protein
VNIRNMHHWPVPLLVLMLAVGSMQPVAALRIGVATYEPDKPLGSSGMSIGIVAAHLLPQGNHSGSMMTQPGGFATGVALHDVILAHGVRCSCKPTGTAVHQDAGVSANGLCIDAGHVDTLLCVQVCSVPPLS